MAEDTFTEKFRCQVSIVSIDLPLLGTLPQEHADAAELFLPHLKVEVDDN